MAKRSFDQFRSSSSPSSSQHLDQEVVIRQTSSTSVKSTKNISSSSPVSGPNMSFDARKIDISRWWGNMPQNATKIYLLDLRSAAEFEKRRLAADDPNLLSVVPFPVDLLKARSFELPARHLPFSVLLDPSDSERVESFLLGRREGARKGMMFKPWKIHHVLFDTPELWTKASELGICEETSYQQPFPQPRLWQPDAMVQNVLLPLLKETSSSSSGDAEIWDLASGAGRDVAFLAEELLSSGKGKSCKVMALDHRYNQKETAIVLDFFNRRGIAENTSCVKLDLSRWENVEDSSCLSIEKVKALFAVRFWKADLIEKLATTTTIPTGTIFGLSQFCKPFDRATWDFDHPSEKTVLERNQLATLFKEKWRIAHDEIASDSDHGRPMIHFVAVKL